MQQKQRFLSLSLLLASLLALGINVYLYFYDNTTTAEMARRSEIILHRKEQSARKELLRLRNLLKTIQPRQVFSVSDKLNLTDLYEEEGISLYIYEKNKLRFWSNNQPAVDPMAYTVTGDEELIHLRNGWYEYIRLNTDLPDSLQLVALVVIKPEYDYQNNYLSNSFSSWLQLPEDAAIRVPGLYRPHTVKSGSGNGLFEIIRSGNVYRSSTWALVSPLLYVFLLLSLIYFIYYYFVNKLALARGRKLILLSFIVLGIRYLMIRFKLPESFYSTELFNAANFANAQSFWFSLLGDVLINSILLLILGATVFRSSLNNIGNRWWLYSVIAFFTLVLFLYGSFISQLIRSLVFNSTISYNINQLFNTSWLSILAILSVAFLIFAFYLFCEKLWSYVFQHQRQQFQGSTVVWTVSILVLLIQKGLWNMHFVEYGWPLLMVALVFLLKYFKASVNFINSGLLIAVSAMVCSWLFSTYEQENKILSQEVLSYKLAERQDAIAENEFSTISSQIRADAKLKNLINLLPQSAEDIEQRLRQVYFSGYFERYDVVLCLVDDACNPLLKRNNPLYENDDYYRLQIEQKGISTSSPDLYFIDSYASNVRYIARIPIGDFPHQNLKPYILYVQMEPKQFAETGAFPEILLDRSVLANYKRISSSYAVYHYGKLVSDYGDYNYPLYLRWPGSTAGMSEKYEGGYHHYIYRNGPAAVVVISDQQFGFWYNFTSNSYFFVFFSIITFFLLLVDSAFFERRLLRIASLNVRIQLLVVLVVICSLIAIGTGTVWLVNQQFENNNSRSLTEKSEAVLTDLQQTLGRRNRLEPDYRDAVTYALKRLSSLFGSDVTMYDTEGNLYSASELRIFEQGLLSHLMSPRAFANLAQNYHSDFTTKDRIGTLKYLSSYTPFYNKDGHLLGYINLPYFARQQNLEKELTVYLTALINIYVILFVLSTIVALIISNLVTKPLRMIKQQLAKINFGRRNEPLKWYSNDEIGRLVNEYNGMLKKLEESALLLAQSERESAWREMAKQVAHEIKNPLTPMKLSIQHLERVIANNPEDLQERVKRVSAMLIEQIDTLSHIATEFSHFAKMPRASIELINLAELSRSTVSLFKEEKVEIHFQGPAEAWIQADKEQMMRVITNLLKNAIQSIPDGREGRIEVSLQKQGAHFLLQVQDNGCGIPAELKQRIFTPNFTTKSTGTGLGLSMVKNIVASFQGSIWFETLEQQGTTFYIRLPSAQ